MPIGFDDLAHLLDEIFSSFGRPAPDDDLFDVTGFGDRFDLKGRLPPGADDAEHFAICRREILGGNTAGRAGAQAAQKTHVDDRSDAALTAMVKRNSVRLCGVRPQTNEIRVLMPGGHHVELLFAAFETAARKAAHFAGCAVAKHFVELADGLLHIDELSSLRLADD